ncbi:DJ-1/PfpI family protein [Brevibacillus sp. AY1]|uniref:DJ-1/PfpI family protein n=1 Tax=Brevibacillus sp. AY1 TaxID=2807621 RepID=UPI002455A280|nr:DJ-1/PfpI family protein [Brevibacillus sp. AY1]MDH4618983.1 DJ-1/PfpI family protein [Brevibacillus sp. AY1]
MWKFLLRSVVYAMIIILLVGGIGVSGLVYSQGLFWGSIRQEPVPSLEGIQKPVHDPNKPTVAVLLGNEATESMDFTIPYQLLSMTGAYNVYAVAEDNQVRSLTGGVDIVPHYSFAELDALLGKSADIIAIPFMMTQDAQKFEPIREWIQKHKDTTLLSICAGSGNLAATGLLDGKTVTTHWQTVADLIRLYPNVNWVTDRRYITNDEGKIISSAGVSSGIDATLYVISQQLGEPMAEKIAKDLNYPSYDFVKNPKVEPFSIDMKYSTYILNNAFQWNKTKAGMLLYNGVEEMAIASVLDIYSDTGTTRILSATSAGQPVVSKHGLNLLPRYEWATLPALDKMIVPGTQATTLATDEIEGWKEIGNGLEPLLVHSDPNRFIFEAQFEDLAKQEDLLTALHAVKRLEFRAENYQLEGNALPYETYGNLLLTLIGAIGIAWYTDRRFILKKKGACCLKGKSKTA